MAGLDHIPGGLSRLLAEDLQQHDGIRIDAVHNPPYLVAIHDTQFVASTRDIWHRTRVWHAQALSSLESAWQEAGLKPGLRRPRRRLDLAVEPNDHFVRWWHCGEYMSYRT